MPKASRVEGIQLTGRPRAFAGSVEVPFLPDKRYQLLAYLAYNGDWTVRERIAALFWPDTDTATSKQNLRALLQRVKAVPFSDEVSVTPHQLLWAPSTDVARYREALRAGRVDEALGAYAGPLLAGLESDDDGEFSEWLEIERERLRGDWRGVALARIRSCGPDETRLAAELYRRLLDDDPLDEEAVRVYLAAMGRDGRVDEARAAYRSFATRLMDEMGLEPTSATLAAYAELERVEQGSQAAIPARGASVKGGAIDPDGAVLAARLPQLGNSFIGREVELAEVLERLRNPECRMLTLLGPGGVGKTRLALRAAAAVSDELGDAVFVALDAIASPDEVPLAIAGALGIVLASGSPPGEQIARALSRGRTLLVLDNFEHVMSASAFVVDLLKDQPGVKLLITSRTRLGLEAEWLYQLEGLAFPTSTDDPAASDFTAITLFVERAKRVQPRFAPDQEQLHLVARVCEAVGGLPLAIEIAAAWMRALSLEEIVAGVASDLDFLETNAPDKPDRQRSIRRTLDHSWSLLSEVEKSVMRRMSVFRSPVPPDAARFVAGATHPVLGALVDRSLLRLGDGRYDRHPLLLAYASEKLAESADELAEAQQLHATYYLRSLRERVDRARGPQPLTALKEIDSEIVEILSAARMARDSGNAKQLISFATLLAIDTGYLNARGYSDEALELLEAAANAATEQGWLVSAHDLRGRLGDAYGIHRGDFRRALDAYQAAATSAREAGNRGREAVLLSMAGVMRLRLKHGDAHQSLDAALELARNEGDELSLATVLEHRAFVLGNDDYDLPASRDLYQESLAVVDRIAASESAEPYEIHRRRFFAWINLSHVHDRLGEQDERHAALREAHAIARSSGNTIWAAHALEQLGFLHAAAGDLESAGEHLGRALECYRQNHLSAHADRLASEMRAQGLVARADA